MFARPFELANREMNQLFDALWSGEGARPAGWFAPASLWEEGDSFFVEAEMPGVASDQLELTLEKNVLRIAAERKSPEGERTYLHNERVYGRIERSVTLPETVDSDSIEAQLKDGILLVKLHKRPESLPKRIEIKTA
jgi:HSP20 family protein